MTYVLPPSLSGNDLAALVSYELPNTPFMNSNRDIQPMIRRYQTKLQAMADAVAEAAESERFALLCRIDKLKRLLILMEEVDHTTEHLMKKALQTARRSSDTRTRPA